MTAETATVEREAQSVAAQPPERQLLRVTAVVVVVAAALFVVTTWAYVNLPPAMTARPTAQAFAPSGFRWLQAWSWWDGAWYVGIAEHGYTFTFGPRRQSAAAFFPAYPLLIRALIPVAGNAVLAGFLLTLASGIGACLVFYAWAAGRVGHRAAWAALGALLLYPCSFYLFGALYADALFVLAAVSAFLFLERDRVVLAGLCGAVATATRPLGVAVAIGLWARTWERRGRVGALFDGRDRGVLLAPLGLLAYCAYLWARFGNPLFFVEAERGWNQAPGVQTWLKVAWFRRMRRPPYLDPPHFHLAGHFLVTVLALVVVVAVFRRLGWGYGVYSLVLVAGAAMSTRDFVGTGRYVMGAFPCFAVVGLLLADRRVLKWAVFALSGGLLLLFTELHARNMLIS